MPPTAARSISYGEGFHAFKDASSAAVALGSVAHVLAARLLAIDPVAAFQRVARRSGDRDFGRAS